MVSSARAARSSGGTPAAWNSAAFHPAPTPRTKRPDDKRSSVAACRASTEKLCAAARRIPETSLIRWVRAAIAVNMTMVSARSET